MALAFEPGVSTSPMITELSGRGLGLAIVKERVEQLSGTLAVESQPGRGTVFRLGLPLTLARMRGVVVRAGGRLFALPTRGVERVARVAREDVKTVENRETVSLAGRTYALARLPAVLGMDEQDEQAPADEAARLPLVVLAGGQPLQAIAFALDEVVDERELLFKPLGRQLERLAHVAGAAVLGGGQVVPVLHVADLLRSAVRQAGAPQARAAVRAAAAPAAKRLLVAEDSITSRTLLKGILEGAGYQVETAADGAEAFAALRGGAFDLLVSDVDMPRLNGFGLTAKVRADRKLAELPVVLVTSLDSRQDREHGIDVGANAYLVKSSFDQGSLLEVVERLL
jgi:two-component system chemotaxis sensor kinase CheA